MASRGYQQPVALRVNCGFARVAILEFSRVPIGTSRASLDKAKRCHKFCGLFAGNELFTMPEEYYNRDLSSNAKFDDQCDFVLGCFNKEWRPHARRKEYLTVFSTGSRAFPC